MPLKSILESILFVYGEPISLPKLARAAHADEGEVLNVLKDLQEEYRKRGVVLLEKDQRYQLGTHPENATFVEELMKSESVEELSRAALEAITIIAYKGPISRMQIEYIRGVNSSFTLRNLLMRGLVERIENPQDARSYLYRVSFDFLKHLGLRSVEELPRYGEFRKEKIEIEIEAPADKDTVS